MSDRKPDPSPPHTPEGLARVVVALIEATGGRSDDLAWESNIAEAIKRAQAPLLAKIAELEGERRQGDETVLSVAWGIPGDATDFTLGDLRRADRALKNTAAEGENSGEGA